MIIEKIKFKKPVLYGSLHMITYKKNIIAGVDPMKIETNNI